MNAASSVATPPALPVSDLDQGRLFLEQTRDGLAGATKLLTTAQWGFKPSPNRWSIAEIVEHVIAVQDRVVVLVRQHLAAAPLQSGTSKLSIRS